MAELVERHYRRWDSGAFSLRCTRPLREPSSIILERSPRGSQRRLVGFQRAASCRVLLRTIGRRERIDVRAENAPAHEGPIGLADPKITAYHGRLLSDLRGRCGFRTQRGRRTEHARWREIRLGQGDTREVLTFDSHFYSTNNVLFGKRIQAIFYSRFHENWEFDITAWSSISSDLAVLLPN